MRIARIAPPPGRITSSTTSTDGWRSPTRSPQSRGSPGNEYPVGTVRLLAPVQSLVVLGMAHNGPGDRQLPRQAFLKSPRTGVGPDDDILVDERRGQVNVEGALAVVIRHRCRNLTPDEVPGRIGPIELMVNNAGLQHREPLLEVSLDNWNRVLQVDLTSAFLVGREVARHQLVRGSGKIINICSVQTDLARPSIAAYTAAKGGLRNLTRAMTAEWAAGGLQINRLAPGYIHTEMTQALVDDSMFNNWILGRTPAARWGTVDDLVGPAIFLASRASSYMNGQVLFVDGGMTAVV